jgi:2'-5' RNA ligase
VGGDERLRLFCALRLPDPALGAVVEWQAKHLGAGHLGAGQRGAGRPVPRENLHLTLAFLGSTPASELPAVLDVLGDAAAASRPHELHLVRYRETRSVGMLVYADPSGEATRLAQRVQAGLEALGLYERERRPWLPHLTVVRFRERPRLSPPLAELQAGAGTCVPSDAAAYLSHLHPAGARYEVLTSFPLGG